MLKALLQLRVFGLGLLEDGDACVGVLPEGEEILVGFASAGLVAGERAGEVLVINEPIGPLAHLGLARARASARPTETLVKTA